MTPFSRVAGVTVSPVRSIAVMLLTVPPAGSSASVTATAVAPLAVPTCLFPLESKKTLPVRTSSAVAVVSDTSVATGGASAPSTPRTVLPFKKFCGSRSAVSVRLTVPPVVYPSGIVTVPFFVPIVPPVFPLTGIPPSIPRILFPLRTFSGRRSATSDSDTVPPVVYPSGIITEPPLVLITPPVAPLTGIPPSRPWCILRGW